MAENGYSEPHALTIKVRADLLETIAGYSSDRFAQELAHAVDNIDTDDAENLRWACALMAEQCERVETAGYLAEASELGRDAGRAAASWIVDGNTDTAQIPGILKMLDDGDPRADDYMPRRPDLSGEWGGDPTPLSIAREITGKSPRYVLAGERDPRDGDPSPELIEALAKAWEEGVDETFSEACESELRKAAQHTDCALCESGVADDHAPEPATDEEA